MLTDFIQVPQKYIANMFGFNNLFIKTTRNVQIIEHNYELKCKMCGNIQDKGYIDPLNTLIPIKTNSLYTYKKLISPFICSYCHFIQSNYSSSLQSNVTQDIGNLILFEDRYEYQDFKVNSVNNYLYELLMNPPIPPYYVMIKKQLSATTFVNMSHTIKPTLNNSTLVINYGNDTYNVNQSSIIQCLEYYLNIFKNMTDLNIADEVLFNSISSSRYNDWFSYNLRNNDIFLQKYRKFLSLFNKETRFISKLVLKTYLTRNNNGNF